MLTILQGDCLARLAELPDESVHCCVTSPPYWGLRDYGVAGQIGLEKTPEEYVGKMVAVFREVRRVLREDGTLWLNLGDSYNGSGAGGGGNRKGNEHGQHDALAEIGRPFADSLKPKDLVGIPWRVAFALQADGWYLRSDIVWHKPNPMPESVTDRPTKSHEYIFLLSKCPKYFYDAEAIKEPASESTHARLSQANLMNQPGGPKDYINGTNANRSMRKTLENYARKSTTPGLGIKNNESFDQAMRVMPADRNKRSVWAVPSAAYSEAHFATFPPDLIKPCILAGTSARGCCPKCGAPWERITEAEGGRDWRMDRMESKGIPGELSGDGSYKRSQSMEPLNDVRRIRTIDWQPTCGCAAGTTPCTVLDPFGGSGTTGLVAIELGRKAVLIELNPKYIDLIRQRTCVTPGLPLA